MSDDVNNCKAIIELFLHFGREKLKKKIIDFVEQNQGRKIILLVKVLPGFGKTFTGSVALLPREDNLTIWLRR